MIPASLPPGIGPAPAASTTPLAAREAPLSAPDYAVAAAQRHGVDPARFKRLIACESEWREDAEGDRGTSFGILQFKERTFAEFTKRYGLDSADIGDPHDQMDLGARMIADGYLSRWKNCARRTGWTLHPAAERKQQKQQLSRR